ncbi:MAG TPA: phosphatase PAP2 family protein [Allosphingosinicella sp.]|nr:phosphatase PAP2 family protein [Allosphingosinicella sp.]
MITQYGVLAYELTAEGEPRFMLITSRSTRRWVIPRGNPIEGLAPHESAAQEAYEEAGLGGHVFPKEVGTYQYGKRRRRGRVDPAQVHVFPLHVTGQSRDFPERDQRETRWFTREEAVEAVDEDSLKSLITAFQVPADAAGAILTRPRSTAPASRPHLYPAPMGALALLAAIWAAMFATGGAGSQFDPPLLALFYAGDNPPLAAVARVITQFGGWAWLTLFSAAFALGLCFKGQFRRALLFLLIVVSGRLLVDAQKILSARDRPEQEHLDTVHSLSFPSGHSANSAIVYLAAAMLLLPLLRRTRMRRLLLSLAVLLTLAIGFTRMILGVHWPSDVAGGWAFGLLWTLLLLRLVRLPGTHARPASLKERRRAKDEQ